VIDLRLMNKIIEYNDEFGFVIIEPGVTFIDLYKFLFEQGCKYIVSGFTGSPDASVMGNALDKGIGRGQYGNRQLSSEVKEVLIANGDLVDLKQHCGFEDTTANLQYSTVGVDLSSIFYQSNFAIVTKIVVHLEQIPEHLLVLSLSIDSDQMMLQLINKFKNLNSMRVIEPVYAIYNDIKMLVASGATKHTQPVTLPFNKWNSSLAIHCCCIEELELKQKLITQQLADINSNVSFAQINKAAATELIKKSLLPNFEPNADELKFLFNLGYTNNFDQRSLYWDSKTLFSQRTNPIDDGCGLIFFVPKIPLNSLHLERALQLLANIAEKHAIQTPITIQFKSKQLLCLVLPILFDLTDLSAKTKAQNYYNELFQTFADHGYIPSRINSISMPIIFNLQSQFNDLHKKIKAAFDQNEIISPKRYSN
jgi:4-cresol dehydrogenase (hydroxylating)